MKVSLNWIKEFTDIKIPADQLVKKIGAQLGAVEEVIDLGQKYQGIIVVKVVACEKHPDADKLSVCTIDDGGAVKHMKRDAKGYVQVVCGAPNARAGMLAAWLPPGSTVPSTADKEPLVLDSRNIRGVVSNGMLASGHELAISDDHSGIIEIDSKGIKPGDDFAEAYKLNDLIIDIENKMFTHRPDCFGMLGVAREIAGIQHNSFKSPSWYAAPAGFDNGSSIKLSVKVADKKQVPRFMAVAISGVKVGPSPLWLQSALARIGSKSINNIVDLTNYIMYLTGQPTHAYDADKLAAKSGLKSGVSLETRQSKKGEKLKLLDGREVILDDDNTILITSNDIPVGIGGVMGGADTEIGSESTNIVLECANFNMYSIRRTSMQYGIFTEAVTRFNKGQSRLQNEAVLARLSELILEEAGGSVSSKVADVHARLDEAPTIKINSEFINSRLGLSLSLKQISALLENVEFKVSTVPADKHHIHIKAPFWRTDIEIPEDVVEEVGRLYGYERLPVELPVRPVSPVRRNAMYDLKARIRSVLARSGANEVLTYSFVPADLFDKSDQDVQKAFQIANAISPDLQHYRLSLTPSLLERVHPNIKAGFGEFAIYEIGKAHIRTLIDADEQVPAEEQRLALVYSADDKTWKRNYSGAAYYQALAYAVQLLESLGIETVLTPGDRHLPKSDEAQQTWAPYDAERTVYLQTAAGEPLGMVGEFKAQVRQAMKLPAATAGFELNLEQLLKSSKSINYRALSRFPYVEQDLTLSADAELPFSQTDQAVRAALAEAGETKGLMASFKVIDSYQKPHSKEKHLTFRFRISSEARTLTAAEVNTILDELAESLKADIGVYRVKKSRGF